MARSARLVAIGFFRANSRFAATTQQKDCDHGRSSVLLSTTWPIFLARIPATWTTRSRVVSGGGSAAARSGAAPATAAVAPVRAVLVMNSRRLIMFGSFPIRAATHGVSSS